MDNVSGLHIDLHGATISESPGLILGRVFVEKLNFYIISSQDVCGIP